MVPYRWGVAGPSLLWLLLNRLSLRFCTICIINCCWLCCSGAGPGMHWCASPTASRLLVSFHRNTSSAGRPLVTLQVTMRAVVMGTGHTPVVLLPSILTLQVLRHCSCGTGWQQQWRTWQVVTPLWLTWQRLGSWQQQPHPKVQLLRCLAR